MLLSTYPPLLPLLLFPPLFIMLGQGSLQIVSMKFLILPLAFKLFSLVVGITAAYVHHITRSHVDAGLKQVTSHFSRQYDRVYNLQSKELWASPRRGSSPGSHWPSPPPGCSSPGTGGITFVSVKIMNRPWGHTSWHWGTWQKVCSPPGVQCKVCCCCCCWPEVASLAVVEDEAAVETASAWTLIDYEHDVLSLLTLFGHGLVFTLLTFGLCLWTFGFCWTFLAGCWFCCLVGLETGTAWAGRGLGGGAGDREPGRWNFDKIFEHN